MTDLTDLEAKAKADLDLDGLERLYMGTSVQPWSWLADAERALITCDLDGEIVGSIDRAIDARLVAALVNQGLPLIARVRAAEAGLPQCAGTWTSGSGGHRKYARDCDKPGRWDAGLWFVCDEHKSKTGGDADAWTWQAERDLLVELVAAADGMNGCSAVELAAERLLIAQARIAELEAALIEACDGWEDSKHDGPNDDEWVKLRALREKAGRR